MVRYSILFLVIAIIATIEFISGFAVSVIPGWHTEIAPPFMVLSIALLVWLYILPVAYFILEKKKNLPTQKLVALHLMLTLFFFFYSNGAFYDTSNGFLKLIFSLGLFIIGQFIYIIVFVRRIIRIKR
jgi:hypothetical protein